MENKIKSSIKTKVKKYALLSLVPVSIASIVIACEQLETKSSSQVRDSAIDAPNILRTEQAGAVSVVALSEPLVAKGDLVLVSHNDLMWGVTATTVQSWVRKLSETGLLDITKWTVRRSAQNYYDYVATYAPGSFFTQTQIDTIETLRVFVNASNVDMYFTHSRVNQDFNLAAIKLRAENNRVVVDESGVRLETGDVVRYQIEDETQTYSATQLQSELTSRASSQVVPKVYARVVAADGSVISSTRAQVDTSGISGFVATAFYLKGIQLGVDLVASVPTSLAWNEFYIIPSSIRSAIQRVEFLLGDFPTQDEAFLSTAWSTSLPNQMSGNQANFWIRLVPARGYVLSQQARDIYAQTNLSQVTPIYDTSAFISALQGLTGTGLKVFSGVSASDRLTWTSAVPIPQDLQPAISEIQYAGGNYASANLVPESAWSTSLPRSTRFKPEERFVYARFVLRPGARVTTTTADLSLTSRVRDVRGSWNDFLAENNIRSLRVRLIGSLLGDLTLDTSSLSVIPSDLQIRYRVSSISGNPITGEELIRYLKFHADYFNSDPARFMIVTVVLYNTNTSKYVLRNDMSTRIDSYSLSFPR